MFEWNLNAKIQECTGITSNPTFEYTAILRYDNKFSTPSSPAQVTGNRLRFNVSLSLDFATETGELSVQHIQILLVCCEGGATPEGTKTKKEQFIGIASIPISYPLAESLTTLKIYKFDKSLYSKANVRASFSLIRTQKSNQRKTKYSSNEESNSNQEESKKDDADHSPRFEFHKNEHRENRRTRFGVEQGEGEGEGEVETNRKLEQILKERDQLYKMSEDLYEELKKCIVQRDDYMRELREKELSEQQIREELQFLKLKIQEEEGNSHSRKNSIRLELQELEHLQNQNMEMKRQLQDKELQLKQLKRQVKESFIAIDEFKKEALEARSELIHKESELSFMTRQSKFLDPYECIEELYQQLENRRFEEPYSFKEEEHPVEYPIQQAVASLKKELAQLFTQLMQKLKLPKQKEWLRQQKVSLQQRLTLLLGHS